MRTTVRLDEELLARLKQYAAQRNRTMASVLEDAVRQLLDRQESAPQLQAIDLITYGSGGMVAEVDINHPESWKQIIEDEDIANFQRITDEAARR